jgi:hypothetical protein
MKAWKGLVGGRKEYNFFGLHEVVEILSLIDGGRRLGRVLEICFWMIRSVVSRCVRVPRVETELDVRATSCSLAFKAAECRRASALFFRVVQFSTH